MQRKSFANGSKCAPSCVEGERRFWPSEAFNPAGRWNVQTFRSGASAARASADREGAPPSGIAILDRDLPRWASVSQRHVHDVRNTVPEVNAERPRPLAERRGGGREIQ